MNLTPDPLAVSAIVDGATVIMAPDMQFVRLDSVGGQIWELIEQGLDIDGIARVLTDRYEVSTQVAREDVEEFVGHLRAAGLVTVSE